MTSVTIGNSVTSIGDNAFDDCTSLTSVEIPNLVTSIGDYAFGCSGLTSVTIGNSVTSIGDGAFYDCYGLTSVTIPNSVTSIGERAFSGCSGLTSIEIPNSVTSIGLSAFDYCYGLTSISVGNENPIYDSRENCNAIIETATNTLIRGCKNTIIHNSVTSIACAFCGCLGLSSIDIPNSVTSIGDYAFCGCTGLTSIDIPNSVKSIGNWAFHYCYDLTSVTIGNSVTSIGEYAFCDCLGLKDVTIPNSVVSIGNCAFSYCNDLKDVTVEWDEPLTVSNDLFTDWDIRYATLHVPVGTANKYRTAECWKYFGNIVEYELSGISSIENEQLTNDNYKYIQNGKLVIKKNGEKYTLDGKRIF